MSQIEPAEYQAGQDADSAYRKRSAGDFLLFQSGLVIPSASGPQEFRDCIQPFQRETFKALAPSLHAVRDGLMPRWKRFWVERTKKSSKDNDLAVAVLWLMAFPKRPFKAQISAANSQQAGILSNRAVELISYNPWLEEYVEIIQGYIRNRERKREVWAHIEATGSSSVKHGEAPELLILNELVHVDRWSVNETHMNNAAGVPRCLVIVSTNAGIKGSPAEKWRRNAAAQPERWKMLVWSSHAPWLLKEDMEEAKRRDPIGKEFARLFRGQWVSGIGDAVGEDAIEECFSQLAGPLTGPEKGWIYLAGLDLGVSHDHAGIAVVGVDVELQRAKLVHMQGFEPSVKVGNKKEVDLLAVEQECEQVSKLFRVSWFGYDPAAGGSFMAQRLRMMGVPMVEVTFGSPTNLTAMATSFVQLVNDRRLSCYDSPDGRLRRDFAKFNIEHTPPNRYRLTAVSDEYGHADVGTAVVICLPEARSLLEVGEVGSVDDDIVAGDNKPLTKEQEDAMPDDLRDIYDHYGEVLEEAKEDRAWTSEDRLF